MWCRQPHGVFFERIDWFLALKPVKRRIFVSILEGVWGGSMTEWQAVVTRADQWVAMDAEDMEALKEQLMGLEDLAWWLKLFL